MIEPLQRRGWLLIAALAIAVALVLLLVPQTHSTNSPDWLAILPILFVGMVSLLSLFPTLAYGYAGRRLNAPSVPARFQRPPPIA